MEPQVCPLPSLTLRPRFVLDEMVVTGIGNVLLSYFTRVHTSVFSSTQLMRLGISLREGRDYMFTVDEDIFHVHWWNDAMNVVSVSDKHGHPRAEVTAHLNDVVRKMFQWPEKLPSVNAERQGLYGVDFTPPVSAQASMTWDMARQGDAVLVTGLNDPSFPSLCVRFADGQFRMDPHIGRYEHGWEIVVSALHNLKRKEAASAANR